MSNIKVRLGISRTNADSQWNPVYNTFHRIFCCGNEMIRRYFCKRHLDAANLRQALGRAAESKGRALGNHFSERICYMFLMSKCRGDRDLSLCTTSVLAFGEAQRNGTIRFFLRRNTFFFRKSPLRICSPNASTEVVHRLRSRPPLHFDIRNI